MQEFLVKAGFTLNEYPEGKFWEKRTGRYSCLQANEVFTQFVMVVDGVVYSCTAEEFKALTPIKR